MKSNEQNISFTQRFLIVSRLFFYHCVNLICVTFYCRFILL